MTAYIDKSQVSYMSNIITDIPKSSVLVNLKAGIYHTEGVDNHEGIHFQYILTSQLKKEELIGQYTLNDNHKSSILIT